MRHFCHVLQRTLLFRPIDRTPMVALLHGLGPILKNKAVFKPASDILKDQLELLEVRVSSYAAAFPASARLFCSDLVASC